MMKSKDPKIQQAIDQMIESAKAHRKEIFGKRFKLTIEEALRLVRDYFENHNISHVWQPLDGGCRFDVNYISSDDFLAVYRLDITPNSRPGQSITWNGRPINVGSLSDVQRQYAMKIEDDVGYYLDQKGAFYEALAALDAARAEPAPGQTVAASPKITKELMRQWFPNGRKIDKWTIAARMLISGKTYDEIIEELDGMSRTDLASINKKLVENGLTY